MRPLTPAVKSILILTIGVFVAQMLYISTFPVNMGELDELTRFLAIHAIGSEYFYPHQFLTHIFMHGSFFHILFNMYALYLFGTILESRWGAKQFVTYYIICGLGAGFIHIGVSTWEMQQLRAEIEAFSQNPTPEDFSALLHKHSPRLYEANIGFLEQFGDKPTDQHYMDESLRFAETLYIKKLNVPTVGASGAVFGLLIAFGMLFPNVELLLLIPPIPIKAKYFVILYGCMEVYAIYQSNPEDNIAHFAHIGGFIVGFIMLKIWERQGKL
jgi:membrane associated rhomboid family serine protease